MRVRIDQELCQGHGRCYDLARDLFAEDDEGYGQVIGDGTVGAGKEDHVRHAARNCPERAVEILEEA